MGAYAQDGSLDVTHVGIFIETPESPMFRNASSRSADNSVVDTPFSHHVATPSASSSDSESSDTDTSDSPSDTTEANDTDDADEEDPSEE
ncbi:hypothetical protein MMUR_28910 [Mycolicibacterium murale]|uniref:Uncharacterized protein n=1 Tax=Mycolicibacterium murale TaxID=182220 RepID=A0A7I9WLZ9_9MYCO|nr:N-acetylmuramoyl-L-alanine amidase-like domain-containing protein [Mycolicibacterium murale]GFG58755.1 hypothetical protein MMUR_28910 [Mycolicibacterium murale]